VNWFWHALWIALVIIPVTLLWISCVISIFLREDLSIWARIGWLLAIFVVPFLGSLAYIINSPSLWRRGDAEPARSTTTRQWGSTASHGTSVAADIAAVGRLHAAGALTDSEFAAAKAEIFSGRDST
jgi:hypothetical protein